jgi:hypothetical protein
MSNPASSVSPRADADVAGASDVPDRSDDAAAASDLESAEPGSGERPQPDVISPARDRAADQTVKRATAGLMRLDSRRRVRSLLRRLCYLLLLVAPIAGLTFYFYEDLTNLLHSCWEQIASKLFPPDPPA